MAVLERQMAQRRTIKLWRPWVRAGRGEHGTVRGATVPEVVAELSLHRGGVSCQAAAVRSSVGGQAAGKRVVDAELPGAEREEDSRRRGGDAVRAGMRPPARDAGPVT
jgi:hypothetical protein